MGNVEMQHEDQRKGFDVSQKKSFAGLMGMCLTSTIWFSGLMSWTWGTLMFMVLPVCSVC